MDSRIVRRAALALLLAASAAPPAAAFAPEPPTIISPPPGHPAANGPSDHSAISQDNRDARLVAYDSAASNLVPGDTNHHLDVFVLDTYAPGFAVGRLSRVSVSGRGRQANGDSTYPSVDGTTHAVPHCIAFQSTATNLARADRSPDSDIYLRDLRHKRTQLVSVGRNSATGASIDGRCRFVVFEASGVVFDRDLARHRTLRIGRGSRPDQQTDGKGVAYQHAGQVWYQALTLGRRGLALSAAPQLVSNTATGAPASGVSENPSLDDHGHYVAFDSTATDICNLVRCGWEYHGLPNTRHLDPGSTPEGIDANGPANDVYLAAIGVPPQEQQSMALVSYDFSYTQLDGPSVDPQLSRAGRGVAFTTAPVPAGQWGIASQPENVFYWSDASQRFGHGHLHLISYEYGPSCPNCTRGKPFNGTNVNPSMSSRGNYIAFTSSATGVGGESNGAGIADVFLDHYADAPR